jgi:hypothetical protein
LLDNGKCNPSYFKNKSIKGILDSVNLIGPVERVDGKKYYLYELKLRGEDKVYSFVSPIKREKEIQSLSYEVGDRVFFKANERNDIITGISKVLNEDEYRKELKEFLNKSSNSLKKQNSKRPKL